MPELSCLCMHMVPRHWIPAGRGGWKRQSLPTQAGANLNREWEAPSAERSPEVLLVRTKMDQARLLAQHGSLASRQGCTSECVHRTVFAQAPLLSMGASARA